MLGSARFQAQKRAESNISRVSDRLNLVDCHYIALAYLPQGATNCEKRYSRASDNGESTLC